MSSQHSQNKPPPESSPTPSGKKGFGVAASPFNRVKMELGMTLFLGFVLWLAADSITSSIAAQLLLLAGYGLISAGWLVLRTRRVVQQLNGLNNQKINPDTEQTTDNDGRLNQ